MNNSWLLGIGQPYPPSKSQENVSVWEVHVCPPDKCRRFASCKERKMLRHVMVGDQDRELEPRSVFQGTKRRLSS